MKFVKCNVRELNTEIFIDTAATRTQYFPTIIYNWLGTQEEPSNFPEFFENPESLTWSRRLYV